MTTVILCENPLNIKEDSVFEVDKVGDFLYNHFKVWPENVKLYQDVVCDDCEIPLKTSEDVLNLNNLKSVVWIVVYPQGYIGLSVALLAATVAIQVALRPKKSKATKASDSSKVSQFQSSPNNSISTRSNSPRLLQRIPDIYGTVRSTPDSLTEPYVVYENNQEVEYGYYCVGRGKYNISEIREGETLLSRIAGSDATIYGPNLSPNNSAGVVAVGKAIIEPFVTAKKSNTATGQILLAPNTNSVGTYVKARFRSPNIIEWDNSQPFLPPPQEDENVQVDLTNHFKVGDVLAIGSTTVGLNGNYVVESVTSNQITLENPGAINANWNTIGTSAFTIASFSTSTTRTLGPFIVEDADSLLLNFSADNGLYQDEIRTVDSNEVTQQVPIGIELSVLVRSVDASDVPFGPTYSLNPRIYGSSGSTGKVAITHRFTPLPAVGRVQVSVFRVTNANLGHKGARSDKVKWESLYAIKNIIPTHFGNVTTIRTKTIANAANIEGGRRLNCKASRLIPKRNDSGIFVADQETSLFADILTAVSLDPRIGNRNIAELDIINFYTTQALVQSTFGTDKAIQFNHTFDDDNLSYEETLGIIAEACFCDVYRQGSVIKLFFEKETETSLLLFNHRNKIPNSETRTSSFGLVNNKDGIELEYFDPKDGTSITLFMPEDQSAINAEKITKLGVNNKLQAYFHVHREWNRLKYQNTVVEFDGTQEALLLNVNERILVADNTRSNTFDGEVISKDGLLLTLSQDFVFKPATNYVIFLQLVDSSVEGIPISSGTFANQVILDYEPSLPLAIDPSYWASTTYEIAEENSTRKSAFLVEEKNIKDRFVTGIKAVNYDSRYYENDTDYIEGVVDILGNPI